MKRLLGSFALVGAAAAADSHVNVATSPTTTTTSRELVFGSSPTVPGRHPYMAALLSGSRQFCAGMLVSSDTILSAAHCADDNNRITSVLVGRHSRLNYQNETDLEEFEVKRIIHHPYHRNGFEYINDHLLHDIVLIKLRGISRHRPIDMNFDEDIPKWSGNFNKFQKNQNNEDGGNRYSAGEELTVMGWGSINREKEKPEGLMSARVHYVPNRICEASSGEISGRTKDYSGYIENDMMCAAAPGRDSCGGDSGGPLLIEGENGPEEDLLVGVVSWGEFTRHVSAVALTHALLTFLLIFLF
mmetsp:Transcript_14723/g.42402  ORF Transcript_14723/g.42402 Transcript_14723/m.42402 type:complete len:301 (+) Transcript_14723:97-999(+)